MVTTDVLWGAWDGRGLEHLRLEVQAGAVRADSLIVSMDERRPFRARYTLECDAGWRLQRARIEYSGTPPASWNCTLTAVVGVTHAPA